MTTFGRHDLALCADGRVRCAACGGSWKRPPTGGCPARRAPSALNSRPRGRPLCRQCYARPASREGICLECAKVIRERARIALIKQIQRDRQAAAAEAQRILPYKHAALAIRFSGFGAQAEPCQIGVVDYDGDCTFYRLIKPSRPIPRTSTAVHGITQRQFAGARSFDDIVGQLFDALDEHLVLVDGAPFVTWALGRACKEAGWDGLPGARWVCVRDLYARYVGDWAPRSKKYRRQPLAERRAGVLQEATAVLNRLRAMESLRPLRAPAPPRVRYDFDEPDDDPDGWEE